MWSGAQHRRPASGPGRATRCHPGSSDRRAEPPQSFRIIGQAKEVSHYRNRQWRGEGCHEVELALAFTLVEQLLDRLIDQSHVPAIRRGVKAGAASRRIRV